MSDYTEAAREAERSSRTPPEQNFLDRLAGVGMSGPYPLVVYKLIAMVRRRVLESAVLDIIRKEWIGLGPPLARTVAVAWVREQYGNADKVGIAQPFSPTGRPLPPNTVGFEIDNSIIPIVKPVLQDPTTGEKVSVPSSSLLQWLQLPPAPAVAAPNTAANAPAAAAATNATGAPPPPAPSVSPPIKPIFVVQSGGTETHQRVTEILNPNQAPAAAPMASMTIPIAIGAALLVLILVLK